MSRGLIIFIKNSIPGKTKTRIAAKKGDAAALSIYKELLDKTRAVCSSVSAERFLYYSDEIILNDEWSQTLYEKELQGGIDLGTRMSEAFANVLKTVDKAIIIGSDCPSITPGLIDEAFDALEHHDVVIGPSFDGGYYLLGLKKHRKELFEHIDWSTDRVFDQTLEKMQSAKASHFSLPMLHDIDHWEDWLDYLRNSAS